MEEPIEIKVFEIGAVSSSGISNNFPTFLFAQIKS
jgi:hypothetical protein